jgi:hypothetical protein
LRDAHEKFESVGMKVYAISYDDQECLSEFRNKQNIPFTLLSDVDSDVIRAYGILNKQVSPEDGFFYGIPYPGVYVTDEEGVLVAKFFHDTYKIRDSAEILIAAAGGKIEILDDMPRASGADDEVKLSIALVGGKGNLRQGVLREVLVRFELSDGLHIYSEPAPSGMVATSVTVKGPEGLICKTPILPPTERLTLSSMEVELQVWSGAVDIRVPIYAASALATEVAPLAHDSVEIAVNVQYQACNEDTCLLPKSKTFTLDVPLDVTEVPAIPVHQGHGQREGNYDGLPHLKRLLKRKPPGRNNPI